MEKEPSTH